MYEFVAQPQVHVCGINTVPNGHGMSLHTPCSNTWYPFTVVADGRQVQAAKIKRMNFNSCSTREEVNLEIFRHTYVCM
jgi:hypothetical protein